MTSRTVRVPAARLGRWIEGFEERHGATTREVDDGALRLTGADGATAVLAPPFWASVAPASVSEFLDTAARLPRCAVVLVRRGGFAAAIVDSSGVVASGLGRRHVQGRTAAGGWSQQRFARRRQKQADELVDAAAARAGEVILPALGGAEGSSQPTPAIEYVVTGGDRALVQQVLADPALRPLQGILAGPHLAVPDPRREVIDGLPEQLSQVRIDLLDPPPPPAGP